MLTPWCGKKSNDKILQINCKIYQLDIFFFLLFTFHKNDQQYITNNQKTPKKWCRYCWIWYYLYFKSIFLSNYLKVDRYRIWNNVLSISDIPLCCLFYNFMIGKTKHLLLTFSEHSRDSRRYGNILKRKKIFIDSCVI